MVCMVIFREVIYCKYQLMMEMKASMMSSCTVYLVLYNISYVCTICGKILEWEKIGEFDE